jgi:hypothetical protein
MTCSDPKDDRGSHILVEVGPIYAVRRRTTGDAGIDQHQQNMDIGGTALE